MRNIRYAWYVLISKASIVVTDRMAAMNMPMIDPYDIKDVLILGAQQMAIEDLQEKFVALVKEHDDRIKQLTHKEGK